VFTTYLENKHSFNSKNPFSMKNILYSLVVLVIFIASCQTKTDTVTFDSVRSKNDLTKTLDTMYAAFTARDINTFLSLLAKDGFFCGTSPKDLWDKATYAKLMTAMLADTSFSTKISVDKREIRFDQNGNSAFVVDQFFFEWNKRIPIRHIIHFVKNGDAWKCDFLSTALIPKDEDFEKIYNSVK
jgi:ketosteroid isomerase-like protein